MAPVGMGVAADGPHGQRCIFSSTFTKLRHDSIEVLPHNTIRDGLGQAYRQQHGLPAAEHTIPDLLLYLDNKPFLCDITVVDTLFLCDITVVDTLANSNLATSSKGAGLLAKEAAMGKVAKYQATADAMRAVHLPSAMESMGGLSESAQQLIREIHHSAGDHCTWREADAIGTHLVDSIAIAVRCTGMALRVSFDRERSVAMGAFLCTQTTL